MNHLATAPLSGHIEQERLNKVLKMVNLEYQKNSLNIEHLLLHYGYHYANFHTRNTYQDYLRSLNALSAKKITQIVKKRLFKKLFNLSLLGELDKKILKQVEKI